MQDGPDNELLSVDSTTLGPIQPDVVSEILSVETRSIGDLRITAERAAIYAENARAVNTKRAYGAALRDFERWCGNAGLASLPAEPQTLALYLTELAETSTVATLRLRIAAINGVHRERGLARPSSHDAVRTLMRGIERTKGVKPKRKDAMTIDLLKTAIATLDGSVRGTRDRAILLLGFSGAFRRSEISGLDLPDLKFSRRGLTVTLRRSKTDQAGAGREVAIPIVGVASLCPVRAVKAWIEVGRIVDGAVFRTLVRGSATEHRMGDQAIAKLVKRVAGDAGLSGDFGGHSLRAGFITSAASKKIANADIKRVSGHRSDSVLADYVRRANVFDDPALLEIMG